MASSTPVTVTVWAMSQSAAVKVRERAERVPSVVSELLRPMMTSVGGLGVEDDGEGSGAAVFGGDQPGGGSDGDAGGVVVGVDEADIIGIDAVVGAVVAGGGGGEDGVGDIPIDDGVIDPGDGDGLGDVPVGGGEGEGAGGEGAF